MLEFHEAMRRRGLAAGQLVLALAGHDRGRIFLVIAVQGRRVALVDGSHYAWRKPKQKHVRHVHALYQLDAEVFSALGDSRDEALREAATRRLIKEAKANCALPQNDKGQKDKTQTEDR